MNRRQFLQAFAAIGVVVAVAEKALVRAVTERAPLLALPDHRVAFLDHLFGVSTEVESRPAKIALARPSATGPLVQWGLNAYGGLLHWQAPRNGAIAITRKHNLRLDADFDGIAVLDFDVPGRGRVTLEYILLRERDPQLRRQMLLGREV